MAEVTTETGSSLDLQNRTTTADTDSKGIKPDKIFKPTRVLATSGLQDDGGLPITNPLATKDSKSKNNEPINIQTDAKAKEGLSNSTTTITGAPQEGTVPEIAEGSLKTKLEAQSISHYTNPSADLKPPAPKAGLFTRLKQLISPPTGK